jgi:hypothetical protein
MRRSLGIALAVFVLLLAGRAWGAAQELPIEFQNLQVLDEDIELDQLKSIMKGFTQQLGVECAFCHVKGEYHLDDLDHKRQARKMMRLVQYLRANKETYFEEDTRSELLACGTCHRGKADVEPYDPAAESWP